MSDIHLVSILMLQIATFRELSMLNGLCGNPVAALNGTDVFSCILMYYLLFIEKHAGCRR